MAAATATATASRSSCAAGTGAARDPSVAAAASSSPLPSLAAVEAGEARIRDHVAFFCRRLGGVVRDVSAAGGEAGGASRARARIGVDGWRELYLRNEVEGTEGGGMRHFVVHQHDHPVSGRGGLFSFLFPFVLFSPPFFPFRSIMFFLFSLLSCARVGSA